jgi:signal transduction histidine kinase
MRITRPTVLILSTNPGFTREIAAHWPADPNAPEFIVLDQGLFSDLAVGNYDLAIADTVTSEKQSGLKKALAAAGKPAILICSEDSHGSSLQSQFTNSYDPVIELSRRLMQGENRSWPTLVALLGREILRRSQAEARARDAEMACEAAQTEATLGRYIAEMRHNVNNALTSVLGNAELLTLEPDLPPNVLAQAETILNMALRLHEVFQRLASIEKELSVAARQPGQFADKANTNRHAYSAASRR